MADLGLYYATNRKHLGADQWAPKGYADGEFSSDGRQNLRLGRVRARVDDALLARYASAKVAGLGVGDGIGLGDALAKQKLDIEAFEEHVDRSKAQDLQKKLKLGSTRLFADLRARMLRGAHVLIYIHGYNVEWAQAVGSALALQELGNRFLRSLPAGAAAQAPSEMVLVLFSWPSEGMAIPWTSYRNDREYAQASGLAVGRGLLKFRDELLDLGRRARGIRDERKRRAFACAGKVHLLSHSMGNYVLQNAVGWVADNAAGPALPRLLDQVFLCAPDVDDDVLEPGEPLGRLEELAEAVHVYSNTGDLPLKGSDWTKGNRERLGTRGPARLANVSRKISHVDCSACVSGLMEHSYYLDGNALRDIVQSMAGLRADDPLRRRQATADRDWRLKPA
jgi:esterase/lipase superfamily enzyme